MKTKQQRYDVGIRAQFALQKQIEERWGQDKIREFRQRLCDKCSRGACSLFPICLNGSDCPYFEARVSKK